MRHFRPTWVQAWRRDDSRGEPAWVRRIVALAVDGDLWLFLAFPVRFVVDSDMRGNDHRTRYGGDHGLLSRLARRLPPGVASQIASGNGERLFAADSIR
jgi:hypothetical protein